MARLDVGARVAVIGAGPGGLVAAKHALEAGFDVTVFEASDDLGGQWNTTAAHSGIWPGMRTNTSRAMTAFSDFPPPPTTSCTPSPSRSTTTCAPTPTRSGSPSESGSTTPVVTCAPAWRWTVSRSTRWSWRPGGSGARCCRPAWAGSPVRCCTRSTTRASRHSAAGGCSSTATASAGTRSPRTWRRSPTSCRRTANRATSCRRSWTVCRPTGSGTRTSARCGAAAMPPADYGALLRERVLRVAGNPADFGAPEPSRGLSRRRPLAVPGLPRAGARRRHRVPAGHRGGSRRRVTFTDGSRERVDAIVCATGYRLDIPYLPPRCGRCSGPTCGCTTARCTRTCRSSASSGSSRCRGRTSRCSNCRPAGSCNAWTGAGPGARTTARPARHRRAAAAGRLAQRPRRRPSPRRPGWRRTSAPGPSSPSRCCSVRCCRRATGWTGRAPGPMRRRCSASSWRRRRVRAVEPDDVAALADVGLRRPARRGHGRGRRGPLTPACR